LIDLSGCNNHGRIVGAVKVGGEWGQALKFDGVDDTVACGNDESLNFERNDSFSLFVWVYTNPGTWFGAVIAKMNPGNDYRGFDLFISNRADCEYIRAHLINSWASGNAIAVDAKYADNIDIREGWHYIGYTYDGSSSANGVKIYIDGNLATMTTSEDALTDTIKTTVNFRVGSREGRHYFNGLIAEVRICARVLSAEEIRWLYELGRQFYPEV